MADLTPNDLSHLSDEEFNALCPQGEHAPGPEPLSPAAQAVLDSTMGLAATVREAQAVAAAALRAAGDQMAAYNSKKFLYSIADHWKLRAIADELENHQ